MTALALLTACGGDSPSDGAASDLKPGELAAPQPGQMPQGFASVYSDFDLEKCTVLDSSEEGGSASYRCPGFGKLALLVQEGDGRFDLDPGADDGGLQTIGAFNDVGETLEWRLKDGTPFALIFRYKDASEEGRGRSVLAVETLSSEGKPGCRVVQIAGDTPDANQRAREEADKAALPDFACPPEPHMIGAAN